MKVLTQRVALIAVVLSFLATTACSGVMVQKGICLEQDSLVDELLASEEPNKQMMHIKQSICFKPGP